MFYTCLTIIFIIRRFAVNWYISFQPAMISLRHIITMRGNSGQALKIRVFHAFVR